MEILINEGGINGTGKGVVNTNSQSYKDLQNIIQVQVKKQSVQEQLTYKLIGLKLQSNK
jgi:hypothetical protein